MIENWYITSHQFSVNLSSTLEVREFVFHILSESLVMKFLLNV